MIEIKNLSKQFEGFQAVENLSLRIETGEFFALRQPLVSLQTAAGLRVKLLLQKRHDLPHSYALDPLRCKQHSLLRAEIRHAIFLQWSHKPTADAVKPQ